MSGEMSPSPEEMGLSPVEMEMVKPPRELNKPEGPEYVQGKPDNVKLPETQPELPPEEPKGREFTTWSGSRFVVTPREGGGDTNKSTIRKNQEEATRFLHKQGH